MERSTQITKNMQRDTQREKRLYKYLLLVGETLYPLVYIPGLLIASLHHTSIASSVNI